MPLKSAATSWSPRKGRASLGLPYRCSRRNRARRRVSSRWRNGVRCGYLILVDKPNLSQAQTVRNIPPSTK
jgi:hypothetical protein